MPDRRQKIDLENILREQVLYDNPASEKQRDILRAAERLFSESGYSDTSTAQIAEKAGVTERTLFKHFPTKQDLLRRILFPLILKVLLPIQVSMMRKVLDEHHVTFRDFYMAIARNRWAEVRVIGPRLKLLIVEALQDNRLRKQVRGLFVEHVWPLVLQRVKNFQDCGQLRKDIEPNELTKALVTTVMSNAMMRGIIGPESDYNDERDIEITFKILFEGMGS